ncbi:YggT family protein [Microbacterium sp. ZKA21]|uniref:YggT family protein n=1 Tax=Microbacterium sp. ZKA21 TaxID=3381694 RepID=UPI003D1F03A0
MGSLVSLIAGIVHTVLLIYIFVLFARLILDYIPLFNREWRPKGFGLVVAEAIYTVTDPPIRFFRRIIPPLRIGGLSLDFGFALTMFIVLILMAVVRAIGGAAS